jgi:nucleotide-binding universal stress UspA family protein
LALDKNEIYETKKNVGVMKMIKTIVVPTDGSSHSKKAIDLAADIAEKYDARMVILHVLMRHTSESDIETLCAENDMPKALAKKFEELRESYLEMAAATYEPGPIFIIVPDDVLKEAGNLILENARQRAEAKGVKDVTAHIVDGTAADKIVATAEQENADMIVMGSRGLGNIAGVLMGSVSHKVSHLSKCTCVAVK